MNTVCDLLKIKYPIIQGGMVWTSGANLAAAVSNAGGLGLIGTGSMQPELLKEHILKAQSLTDKPFGVNVPIFYHKAQEQIEMALSLGVKIFFTSAGSPKKYTQFLKDKGAIVVHVCSSPELALKCQEAGVDAVVCEGFEAGGHNGREEITTMTLIPQAKKLLSIPVIAAGGIATGGGMLAAMSLGADGVQMGTRFLMTKESSAHDNFKQLILTLKSNSTQLLMKSTIPVRLVENKFSNEIKEIESSFHGQELVEKLMAHLGKSRAKNGIFLGDLVEGELEIGQIGSLIKDIPSVEEMMREFIKQYNQALSSLKSL